MKRKLFYLLVIGLLAISLAGCAQQQVKPTPTPAPTATPTPAATPTGTPTPTPTPIPAKVIETDSAVVIIGEKGKVESVSIPTSKKVIKVSYVVDKEKTKSIKDLMEAGQGFGAINPAFWRNTEFDALVKAARIETNPDVRAELFKAMYIIANKEAPLIVFGQNKMMRVYWDWVEGRYYHPTFTERYDLIWEKPDAPTVDIGIKDYKNDANTLVIGTIGWPESFDPAMTYETFGWEIWHQIGDTLVTYWKEETEKVSPDLAVAWAHNKDGTEWYFVIRGDVVAYDPWNKKTYPIDATDVAFSFWRVKRLGHSVSWMLDFTDLNKSVPLTEDEFKSILSKGGIYAEYGDKSGEVKSMDDLLSMFGYNGKTAGVYKLVLPEPYAPILGILTDPFLSVLPMEYLLGDKYQEALAASDNGKNPAAWTAYVSEGKEDATHQLMHKKPVCTGPYCIVDYEENSYIVAKMNPYYWDKALWDKMYSDNTKAKHETVIWVINNDAVSRINLFQTGTVDFVAAPPERINDVKGLTFKGFHSVVRTDLLQPIITYGVFNTYKEPFNNPKVREALAYAVPYDQIIKQVYSGNLVRNYAAIPIGWPGYTEYGIDKYTFDMAKAKQFIKESGIDPTKYTIEITYNSGNSAREKISALLQNTWSQLGFKCTVTSLEWPVYLSKGEHGQYDYYTIGWVPDYLDTDNWVGPLYYGATQFKEVKVLTE